MKTFLTILIFLYSGLQFASAITEIPVIQLKNGQEVECTKIPYMRYAKEKEFDLYNRGGHITKDEAISYLAELQREFNEYYLLCDELWRKLDSPKIISQRVDPN